MWVQAGGFAEALVGQAVTFPHGNHDDLVDAASGALGMTIGSIGARVRIGTTRQGKKVVEW